MDRQTQLVIGKVLSVKRKVKFGGGDWVLGARSAPSVPFKKGSSKVYDYSTIHNLVGKFPRALARGEEKGVGEIRICLASKCEFGGWAK